MKLILRDKCPMCDVSRSSYEALEEKLRMAVEALEQCHDMQDNDYVETKTEDDEIETWVNSNDIRSIVDNALANIEKAIKPAEGREG